jgi:hypothetical protein
MRAFVAASFCFFKSSSTTSSLNRYFRKIANLLFIFFDNRCLKSILTHKIVNVALILRNLVKSHEVQRPLVLSQKDCYEDIWTYALNVNFEGIEWLFNWVWAFGWKELNTLLIEEVWNRVISHSAVIGFAVIF